MQLLTRTILSGSGGLIISTGLALAMVAMIRVEFEAQSSKDVTINSINPCKKIKEPPVRTVKLVKLKKVDIPPAAPVIKTKTAKQPRETVIMTDQVEVDWDPKGFGIDLPTLIVADRAVDCLICIAPIMPPRATKSGHCKMRLDVGPDGSPFNIKAKYCTEGLFERNAVKAIRGFKYNPEILNGQAVSMTGITETITYRLLDERGHLIPE